MNYQNALSTLRPASVRLSTLSLTLGWGVISMDNLFEAVLPPAPNYEEACAAESRADFIHKLGICLKELRESRCWIRLIIRTELLPEQKMSELYDECNQLCNLVAQSIVTAKVNREKKR